MKLENEDLEVLEIVTDIYTRAGGSIALMHYKTPDVMLIA